MSDNAPPVWFWVIAVLGLLWNLAGVAAFVMQMTLDLSSLPDAQRAVHESTPIWATAAFAVAVVGGVLGCLALLSRKAWAFPMFIVSLAGIVIQTSHSLVISNGLEVFGPQGFVLPALIFTLGGLLAWFAKTSASRNWLS